MLGKAGKTIPPKISNLVCDSCANFTLGIKTSLLARAWWGTPVTPAVGRQRRQTVRGRSTEGGSQSAPSGEGLSHKRKARATKMTPLVKNTYYSSLMT